MCGIVGYVGRRPAGTTVVNGLQALEVRGYDSAGVCISDGAGALRAWRAVGPVASLLAVVPDADLRSGVAGIGHTRWATHGAVEVRNAHPFLGCTGAFAVVMNGICENHASLRAELVAAGHRFESDTDAEIAVHLLEAAGASLDIGMRLVAERMHGSLAIVAVAASAPGRLVALRRGAPLVVGVADDGRGVASSVDAMPWAARYFALEDDDVVALTARTSVVGDAAGRAVLRPRFTASVETHGSTEGSSRFESEVAEQSTAIRRTLDRHTVGDAVRLQDGAHRLLDRPVRRLILLGCGTSFNAGLASVPFFERWSGVPVEVHVASEWRPRGRLDRRDVVVAISQSGETADTLAAVGRAARLGAATIALTNSAASQLARDCDAPVVTAAGPERSVAATKSFTTQVLALALIALAVGEPSPRTTRHGDALAVLRSLPGLLDEALGGPGRASIRTLAAEIATAPFLVYLGSGDGMPIAHEGALKMRELAYAPVEVHPIAELKHGPFALLGPGTPVLVIASGAVDPDRIAMSAAEIRARGARLVVVGATSGSSAGPHGPEVLPVPVSDPMLQPLLSVIPLQLLAHDVAVARGNAVDTPRNLAKTVTVR